MHCQRILAVHVGGSAGSEAGVLHQGCPPLGGEGLGYTSPDVTEVCHNIFICFVNIGTKEGASDLISAFNVSPNTLHLQTREARTPKVQASTHYEAGVFQ